MTTDEIILEMCCKLAEEWKLEAIIQQTPIKVFLAMLTVSILICNITGRLEVRDISAAVILSLQVAFMVSNRFKRVDNIISRVLSEEKRRRLASKILSIILKHVPNFQPIDVDSAMDLLTPECKNAMMRGVMEFLRRLPNYNDFTALASNIFP
nr:uncharacterized protein LOC111509431 [Leptinotarsa decemlineata]